MMTLKTGADIKGMYKAGQLLAACHRELKKRIRPGVTTIAIDRFVESYLRRHGATPEQKGYNGYAYATCASVNDEICHGFPRHTPLRSGDVVTIDFVVNRNGSLADSAWTYAVGTVSVQTRSLMNVAKAALYKGIEQARSGNRIGDIGYAIQTYAEQRGYSVVREFTGHGIGPTLHEEPSVPHVGRQGTGLRLKEGMVITIEPVINAGSRYSKLDTNGWTARTVDGKRSAQYEHTVAVTREGPLILTKLT